MPVYYNEDEDENRRRQNGNPNYGTNANFTDYHELQATLTHPQQETILETCSGGTE
jgi:hypothetical protein